MLENVFLLFDFDKKYPSFHVWVELVVEWRKLTMVIARPSLDYNHYMKVIAPENSSMSTCDISLALKGH